MRPVYNKRTYREWVQDQDLISFQIKIAESDLFIRARKRLALKAKECLHSQRQLIQDYIQSHPGFAAALQPYSVGKNAPAIIKEMAQVANLAQVGPMAAVAGAIAEYIGRELLKYSTEVIVENGGDIFMKTDKVRRVGIFAGQSYYTGKLALELAANERYGICTSSSTVGPSLSFGKTDAAVTICDSAILADAWATRLGNMVKSFADMDKTLRLVKDVPEIKGAIIIISKKIGICGDIKLVRM